MSQAQHTPGPWKATFRRTVMHIHSDSKKIASMGSGHVGLSHEDDANARLIAAAPDLLNALSVLADAAEARGIPADAARTAIAKARGE